MKQKDVDRVKRYRKAYPNDKRKDEDILSDIKLEIKQHKDICKKFKF
jgi:hypothetical protein